MFIGNQGNTPGTIHPRLIAKDIAAHAARAGAQKTQLRPTTSVLSRSRAFSWFTWQRPFPKSILSPAAISYSVVLVK